MLLLLTLLTFAFCHIQENDNRVILLYTTVTLPYGTPIPAIDLSTIVDPYFIRQTQFLNFYRPSELLQLKQNAFAFYNDVWGWNFTAAQYNPGYDAYFLPGVGLFPYTRLGNVDFPITFDSRHNKRSGKWILHQVGYIAVVNVFVPPIPCTIETGLGNYSGLKNMSIKYPGDLIEFSDFSFSHPDLGVNKTHTDPNNPKYREVIKVRALWSSRQVNNGEGASDTHGKLQAAQADKHGKYPNYDEISENNGYESSTVHRAIQPNGDNTYYGRASWVFPGRNQLTKGIKKRNMNDNVIKEMLSNPLSR